VYEVFIGHAASLERFACGGTSPVIVHTHYALKADELVPLALRGLERLYDEAHGLFGFQFRAGRRVRMHAALSIRYTAISILGLIRARVSGEHETILDEGRILERLVPQIESASGSGDLGLILWADALAEGHNQEVILAAITRRVKVDGSGRRR
jgi:hypothetical protein